MSEMIGAKKNDSSGLAPEFENNPYEKLDDLLFDSELEYIVSVEDDYLKQALAQFLNDHNLRQKTKDFKSFEYMFISFDLGTFNFIEKPNYEDKRVYELPYDWSELMSELKDYLSEHKFEKHVIADKNKESWAQPREDDAGSKSDNSGKSFLDRAKEKILGTSGQDRKSKMDGLLKEVNSINSDEISEIIRNSKDIKSENYSSKQNLYIFSSNLNNVTELVSITDSLSDFQLRIDGDFIKDVECGGYLDILTEEEFNTLTNTDLEALEFSGVDIIKLTDFKGDIQVGAVKDETTLITKFGNSEIYHEISQRENSKQIEIFINLPKNSIYNFVNINELFN